MKNEKLKETLIFFFVILTVFIVFLGIRSFMNHAIEDFNQRIEYEVQTIDKGFIYL